MDNAIARMEEMIAAEPSTSPAASMGINSEIKRKVRRARRLERGEMSLGEDRESIVLPDILKNTLKNERFLLADIPGKNRILIYSTDEMLNVSL